MIVGNFSDVSAVTALGIEPLTRAIEWARDNYRHMHDMIEGENGRITLEPGVIWANVETPKMRLAEQAPLELHHLYADIHIPVSAPETIGYTPASLLGEATQPYDAGRDIAFYSEAPLCHVNLAQGDFAVMFTHDAHAPLIGEAGNPLQKICIKVKI